MCSLDVPIPTRVGERVVSMNSTLVETVSINYEDFNESFLTCGTCLYGLWTDTYDGSEHTPKLLQCSHTVCLHCLTRIAASQTRDTGTFRCPICREQITIPRGGVSALPPSFLVNQLLDLMSRQRREVVPKCPVHINKELLFCETCDIVFCTQCTGGGHSNDSSANSDSTQNVTSDHTIIPFSIAIKRMSEILLYKANECMSKLNQAQEDVTKELGRLDGAKDDSLDQVNAIFQQVQSLVDKRKQEMIEAVNAACAEKRKVLEEQHSLIESEKNKVKDECQGLQHQVEVRNISQRIDTLTKKVDAASTLGEPRENAFLTCDFSQTESLKLIEQNLSKLGKVRTSTTFPSLCKAHVEDETIVGIENHITLTTVDYHGDVRQTGGDPVEAKVEHEDGSHLPTWITDCEDGTYRIHFRAAKSGKHCMRVTVFDRPIKDVVSFEVTEHNNPVETFGSKGSGKDEFNQPVGIAIDESDNMVYVLDTGNSRIKVLNTDLEVVKHISNEGLLGRSCTGIAISNEGLVVVNWRTKVVTEMTTDGDSIKNFTYNAFMEPIDVAVDKSYGHILVADNGMSCVYVFDSVGKILFQVGKKGTFSLISSVTVGPLGEIIVADSRIQVFSAKGDPRKVLFEEGQGKGRYGGIAVDSENRILASRTEPKSKNYVQLLSLTDDDPPYTIDSHDSKLKRPSGVAVTHDNHVVVVDLGNNCIKKYRYW
ncbi:tripartite motif-containing protein 2-like isoform X4 [Atheta coriaria]|uniref:tripartite motif-containing protein 2-like isoform X4 n=1 Tax=Dalotia coriaria TaxID=877792 RepID=UPI0031F37779